MVNKLAFVGPQIAHEGFSKMSTEWDFQVPFTTPDAFTNAYDNMIEDEFSSDTKMVIFFTQTFDKRYEELADLVTHLAPDMVVGILILQKDEIERTFIDNAIEESREHYKNKLGDEFNEAAPYYYIEYEEAQTHLIDAVNQYVSDPNVESEVRNRVRSLIPEAAYLDEDNIEETNEDEIIIPELAEHEYGEVIVTTSSKGGSGKSTVSVSLASMMSNASINGVQAGLEDEPLKICVVDLDVRDGQLGIINGATSKTPNVANIFQEYDGITLTEEQIQSGIYKSKKHNLDFIFAVSNVRFASQIPPNFYAELIQRLRGMYDFVILDTSVNYLDPLLEKVAYPLADKILFVTDMGASSVVGMARWIRETTDSKDVQGSAIDKGKIGIVVNKTMLNVGMTAEKIESAAQGIEVLAFLPSVPSLMVYASNTNSLDRIFSVPQINKSFDVLARSVVEPSGYTLGTIPHTESV